MTEERLQKVLAAAGVASRRAAEALIAAGRVTVDGRVATVGEKVDPAVVAIAVDGRPLRAPSRPVHLALNKPAGVTSTVRDRHAGRTVLELVAPDVLRGAGRLYPVGRLDKDSEGLILLTNDGPWAERVLHPRHHVEREYALGLRAPLDGRQVAALTAGIELEEGHAGLLALRRASATEVGRLAGLVDPPPDRALAWYRVTLGQGMRRQLRRMFGAVGAPLERLVRVRVGTVRLDGIGPGAARPLTPAEVRGLAPAAGRGTRGAPSGAGILRAMDRPPEAAPQPRRPVVAIDGPGSSGKSTVGAHAARSLGLGFCDTGLLYRALTWLARERGVAYDDAAAIVALVPEVSLAADDHGRLDRVLVGGRDVTAAVRTPGVDAHVSEVARQGPVRDALLPVQRSLAARGGIVMAGRDIGTVVLPDADVKVYLDASAEERARRRAAERGIAPDSPEAAAILAALRRRDATDGGRAVSPLRVPPDAVVVRSDGLDLEETVARVVEAIVRATGMEPPAPRPAARP